MDDTATAVQLDRPTTGTGEPTVGQMVVVGVDGSTSSSAALEWAAEEARLRGGTLKVVRSWQFPANAYDSYLLSPSDTVDWPTEARQAFDEQVDAVVGKDPRIDVLREVNEGPAARVLLAAAEGADLLVVGSRGRGGFTGLLLGSVSSQVAHHARCPVVIVRGQS